MSTVAFSDLVSLFANLVVLSLATNGSALAAAPDLRGLMVNEMSLVSDRDFNASIAIAHAAPGPNLLFVAAIGYQAAGFAGAAVTLGGMLLPSTTLAYAASRWGHANGELRALRALKTAIAPVVVTLPLASGWILASQAQHWGQLALTVAAALLAWLTRVHVLAIIAVGAAIGALGLV